MPIEEKIVNRIDELLKKGNVVLATVKQPNPDVFSLSTLDSGTFAEWRTQTLNFLINLLGRDHVYTQEFEKKVGVEYRGHVEIGQGILRAVREDVLGGYLTNVRTLISAEVFTDFLEMVAHLLENKYKDPAASLCGAVLEDGLRRIASHSGLQIKSKEDLNSLNQKCADGGIYNRLIQKKIQVWSDIRNNADHGKFNEYSEKDVRDMHSGVSQILTDFLR